MKVMISFIFTCLIVGCFTVTSLMSQDIRVPGGFGLDSNEDERNNVSEDIDMSYLQCDSEVCKVVKAYIKELPGAGPWVVDNEQQKPRLKRRIFLPDNRLSVREKSVKRFPFNSTVAIRVDGVVTCSGVALLKDRFFLTAAHCVQPHGKRKGRER